MYPQSMFWVKNKENRYTHVNPSFAYKIGVRGGMLFMDIFPEVSMSSRPMPDTHIIN